MVSLLINPDPGLCLGVLRFGGLVHVAVFAAMRINWEGGFETPRGGNNYS